MDPRERQFKKQPLPNSVKESPKEMEERAEQPANAYSFNDTKELESETEDSELQP